MAVISLLDRRLRRIDGPARAAADDASSTRPWIGPTYLGPMSIQSIYQTRIFYHNGWNGNEVPLSIAEFVEGISRHPRPR